MWKTALAGIAMIAIAGSSLVYAQQRRPDGDPPRASEFDQFRRWRPSAEDASAIRDARIAALHTVLRLTPEQEKMWPPVEQALRDLMRQRFERRAALRDAPPSADPMERMRSRAAALQQAASGLQRLVDAADPLYRSLDEGQKQRMAFLMRGRGAGPMGPMGDWHGRGPGMGPGMGPGGMGPGGPHMRPGMGPGMGPPGSGRL